jgi:hypothetical protein
MKINLKPSKKQLNSNQEWMIVSLWDSEEKIPFQIESNQTPEEAALFELGYRIQKIKK